MHLPASMKDREVFLYCSDWMTVRTLSVLSALWPRTGSVRMPLQEIFWAERFGGVTDQYGITREIKCEKPQ